MDNKLYDIKVRDGFREVRFVPWHGELGWEVMSWAPYCRKIARHYDIVTVTSFAGMGPLYSDFATEFRRHEGPGRSLEYPKMYRPDGIYYRYGRADRAEIAQQILIHARGISRKSSINYRRWDQVAKGLSSMGLTAAFIGSDLDRHVSGYPDFRSSGLQKLMDRMAAARLVIGCSSGVMHLAAACGTDIVAWGDGRTYFRETLETRYKVTWNPFEVRVGWITADDWQPEPAEILKKIELILRKTGNDKPVRDGMRKVI